MARPGKSRRNASGASVPEVYQDMLADAGAASSTDTNEEGRRPKKRRIGGRVVTQPRPVRGQEREEFKDADRNKVTDDLSELFEDSAGEEHQTIRSLSEASSDEDANWEEVDLTIKSKGIKQLSPDTPIDEGLDLVLETDQTRSKSKQIGSKRRSVPAAEKKLRFEIHKMHLCCLLIHAYIRNHWCNDEQTQAHLKKLLSSKTISYLNPSEKLSQFQQSRSFMDGLEQASNVFRRHFKIDSKGLCRVRWAENNVELSKWRPPPHSELPLEQDDFLDAAKHLKGSRDLGAQLFCTLLRSAGVEARIIFSMQCLPFNSSPLVNEDPRPQYAAIYTANAIRQSSTPKGARSRDPVEEAVESTGLNGQGSVSPNNASAFDGQRRGFRESKYPVFWVEAFNDAVQKWIPVDPIVTGTLAKPSKLEPPAGDPGNSLVYVVAFEEDGSARDVTRRYAKAYNAKTRRDRVEGTKSGVRWWKGVMRMFRRRARMDRDQVEDAELASKEGAEPMPKNVQDFKDHPYYALERHMKRNEVIHPKREVGKVGTGKSGGSTNLEPIFRRRDVLQVQSADKWYRIGREIKEGEQPLKRVSARTKRDADADMVEEDQYQLERAGVGLYALFQTKIYEPPQVINGIIPKNAYGNLDIYVPSMVPSGATHIEDPATSHAAKILGIDYADAVTGFVFKGRHSSTTVKGAVVATAHREAVLDVIHALNDERLQQEEERRALEALRFWKRFLAGLRIKERIDGYEIEGEHKTHEVDTEDEDMGVEDAGGGFFPEEDGKATANPTAGTLSGLGSMPVDQRGIRDDNDGGGFMIDDEEGDEEMRNVDIPERRRDRFLDDFDKDTDGDFLVEDDHEERREAEMRGAKVEPKSQNLSSARPHLPVVHHDFGSALLVSTSPSHLRQHQERAKRAMADTPSSQLTARPALIPQASSAIQAKEWITTKSADASVFYREDTDREAALPATLPANELAEARLLQSYYDRQRSKKLSSTAEPDPLSSPTAKEKRSGGVASDKDGIPPLGPPLVEDMEAAAEMRNQAMSGVPMESTSSIVSERETERAGSDSGTEKGSLLSADPEDEDAEPEWLA